MNDDLLFPLTVILSVIGFFFVAVVAASLWEKRLVQPYYVPPIGQEYEPSPDAARANRDAQEIGYRHGGLCHDGKGKLYRVRYDFWIAPDNSVIAVVGSGTLAKIPVNGIWLYSRTAGGRILSTTNEKGEQDISEIDEQKTWPEFRFKALVDKHQRRLAGAVVESFPAEKPMAGYFDIRRRKADALVDRGYAYFLDDDRRAWRYTLKGALTFYVIGLWGPPIGRYFQSLGLVRGE